MEESPSPDVLLRPPLERRTAPRVAATLAVEILRDEDLPPLSGQSLDVGTGGVCVQTSDPFDAADVSCLRLDLEGKRCVLPARVRWQRGARGRGGFLTGLQFGEIAPREREALWSLMQTRALQIARFLLESRTLSELDLDGALDLALLARRREFPPHAPVYRAGSRGDWEDSIFVIVNGDLDLDLDLEPRSTIRLAAGAVFGGVPLVLGTPHAESARPATHVQALEIDAYSYERLRVEKPVTARLLDRAVAAGQVERLTRALRSRVAR